MEADCNIDEVVLVKVGLSLSPGSLYFSLQVCYWSLCILFQSSSVLLESVYIISVFKCVTGVCVYYFSLQVCYWSLCILFQSSSVLLESVYIISVFKCVTGVCVYYFSLQVCYWSLCILFQSSSVLLESVYIISVFKCVTGVCVWNGRRQSHWRGGSCEGDEVLLHLQRIRQVLQKLDLPCIKSTFPLLGQESVGIIDWVIDWWSLI